MSEKIIEVVGLTKEYTFYDSINILNIFRKKRKKKLALKNINFSIDSSEDKIFSILGHNGSGKTTLIKILSGILKPTKYSKIKVLGFNPFDKTTEFKKRISVVNSSRLKLWQDLSINDNIDIFCAIYNINRETCIEFIDNFVDRMKLRNLLDKPIRLFSLGEKIKSELLISFIHSPKLIFLDEPTIGLDIDTQYEIRSFLKEYAKKYGSTIILTTHNIADVEYLSDQIIILKDGIKSFHGSKDLFFKKNKIDKTYNIRFVFNYLGSSYIGKFKDQFPNLEIVTSKNSIEILFVNYNDSVAIIKWFENSSDLINFERKDVTLEYFIRSSRANNEE
ncbi:MAG: multidrug ABC transporter ATP-binding protein [Candidatus Delongbacteria bacterium]|nr:MAG: multidrug ABC transporter ATP-binding protein [Candidatus Delongbacteria bacterium]